MRHRSLPPTTLPQLSSPPPINPRNSPLPLPPHNHPRRSMTLPRPNIPPPRKTPLPIPHTQPQTPLRILHPSRSLRLPLRQLPHEIPPLPNRPSLKRPKVPPAKNPPDIRPHDRPPPRHNPKLLPDTPHILRPLKLVERHKRRAEPVAPYPRVEGTLAVEEVVEALVDEDVDLLERRGEEPVAPGLRQGVYVRLVGYLGVFVVEGVYGAAGEDDGRAAVGEAAAVVADRVAYVVGLGGVEVGEEGCEGLGD